MNAADIPFINQLIASKTKALAIPKTASFAASAGKHYSVNTDNAVVVTEVFASGALDGIRFTGTSWNQVLTILFYYSEGNPVGYDNSDPTTLVLYGDSALTLQDIIDMVNGSGIVTAAVLYMGALWLFPEPDYVFGPQGPRWVPSRAGVAPEVVHNANSAAAKAAARRGEALNCPKQYCRDHP